MIAAPMTALAGSGQDVLATPVNPGDYEVDFPVIQGPDFGGEFTVTYAYKYSDGTAGFFKSIGATEAAKIASGEGVTGSSATKYLQDALDNRSSTSSPFNLDAMRTSIEILEQCNEKRALEGESQLKVDPTMMAYSQVAAAWASHYGADSAVSSNPHAVFSEYGIGIGANGENLAWNSSDVDRAFVQWYDDEKALYDWCVQKGYDPDDPTDAQIRQFQIEAGIDANSTGHYTNMISSNFKSFGAAYCDGIGTWNTYAQSFDSSLSSKTYTVSEFKQLFDDYCDKLEATKPHAVKVANVANGTASVSSTSAVQGTKVTVTVTPDDLYYVAYDGVTVTTANGTKVTVSSTGDAYSFTMPASDVTVNVKLEHKRRYAQFYDYDGPVENGTVTVSPEAPQKVGETVTLTIKPDKGYQLESISAYDCLAEKNLELSGTGNTRTFTMPDADVRLHATFVPATAHKITAAKPDGGTVTLSRESALAGDEVTVTLAPSEGYELTSVSATDATGKAVALSGTGSTRTFVMPDADVTLTVVFTQTAPEPGSGDGYRGFPDVMGDEWFATDRALGYVVDHGLIEGYKDGSFGASRPVTRAQLVTVLWRMAGKPSATSEPFLDADPKGFYWNALQWARANKIASGYSDTNKFGPDDQLTRETLATFAASYARLQGIDTSGYESELNAFADASKVSTWARSSMGWCVHVGIFSGQGSTGLIDPQGVADRAQMAKIVAMLHRDVLHLASAEEYAAEKDRQSALAANPSVIRSTPSSQDSDIVVLTGTVRKTMGTQFTYGGSYPIYYLELPAEVTVTGTQYGPIANTRLILPKGYESYVGKTVSVRTGVSIRPTASIPEAAITMLWCNKYCTFQRVF